jgi:hypothetical protein
MLTNHHISAYLVHERQSELLREGGHGRQASGTGSHPGRVELALLNARRAAGDLPARVSAWRDRSGGRPEPVAQRRAR